MRMKRHGCLRTVLLLAFAVALLYFTAGEGKKIVLRELYPVKYQTYVEKYSGEYGIDKYLVYSIMKVESGFDPKAVSNVGAKGLMQLMDTTAAECSRKADFGYVIPDDMFDAEKNIRTGCYYLKTLMDTYGDTELAVTAYNGGTGNVRKWLGNSLFADGEGGLSDIPYAETKNYVKKVLKAYEIYTNLYKMQ